MGKAPRSRGRSPLRWAPGSGDPSPREATSWRLNTTPPPVPAHLVLVAPTLKGSRPLFQRKENYRRTPLGAGGAPSLLGIRVAAALGTPVCQLLAMTPDIASLESEGDGGSERLRFPCRAAWLQCQPQTEGTQPLTTDAFALTLCRAVGLFQRSGMSLAKAGNCCEPSSRSLQCSPQSHGFLSWGKKI